MILEYIGIIITVVGLIIAVVFIIKNRKKIKISGGEIFGIGYTIDEMQEKKLVEKIKIIRTPIAACSGEPLTPNLKIKVLDNTGASIAGKKVKLEFYDNLGLMNIKDISGELVRFSDECGCIEFNNICIYKSGYIKIFVVSDEIEQSVDLVEIFPPGLSIDYWNEKVGTKEYKVKLDRVLQFHERYNNS